MNDLPASEDPRRSDGAAPLLPTELLDHLGRDAEPPMSCDTCFDIIDEFVQRFVDEGTTLPHALRAHLNDCGVCLEEADTLIALLATDGGDDVDIALTRFHHDLRADTA